MTNVKGEKRLLGNQEIGRRANRMSGDQGNINFRIASFPDDLISPYLVS
jgi:hypothetical protein